MRLAILLASFSCVLSQASADMPEQTQNQNTQNQSSKRFESFTGKITGHNVRMRLHPSLDAQVFKELDKDELVLVTGVSDDFYACMPPKDLKAYIFRTYVLDGVVEGSNVFVRLGPDRTSPSIAQLNSGDVVKGTISTQNNKWLQIDLPEDVRFYVAKDYVQKAGGVEFFAQQEQRKLDAAKTLADLEAELNNELDKPFQRIQLASISQRLNQFIRDHKDMPQAVSQAEALIAHMQQLYLTRGVALGEEAPAAVAPQTPEAPKTEAPKTEAPKSEASKAQKAQPEASLPPSAKPITTLSWQENENNFIANLIASGKADSSESYYQNELVNDNTLHGTIKHYNSFLSTRPGDFVLLNLKTNLPIAYLYSTKEDLSAWINKPVTIWVSERPNNNFAFPAYFVLQVEE